MEAFVGGLRELGDLDELLIPFKATEKSVETYSSDLLLDLVFKPFSWLFDILMFIRSRLCIEGLLFEAFIEL